MISLALDVGRMAQAVGYGTGGQVRPEVISLVRVEREPIRRTSRRSNCRSRARRLDAARDARAPPASNASRPGTPRAGRTGDRGRGGRELPRAELLADDLPGDAASGLELARVSALGLR